VRASEVSVRVTNPSGETSMRAAWEYTWPQRRRRKV
jgi:hypothetical protein